MSLVPVLLIGGGVGWVAVEAASSAHAAKAGPPPTTATERPGAAHSLPIGAVNRNTVNASTPHNPTGPRPGPATPVQANQPTSSRSNASTSSDGNTTIDALVALLEGKLKSMAAPDIKIVVDKLNSSITPSPDIKYTDDLQTMIDKVSAALGEDVGAAIATTACTVTGLTIAAPLCAVAGAFLGAELGPVIQKLLNNTVGAIENAPSATASLARGVAGWAEDAYDTISGWF